MGGDIVYKILLKMIYEEKTETFINNCETCTIIFFRKRQLPNGKIQQLKYNKKLVQMAKYLSIAKGFQIPSININFVNCTMLIC